MDRDTVTKKTGEVFGSHENPGVRHNSWSCYQVHK